MAYSTLNVYIKNIYRQKITPLKSLIINLGKILLVKYIKEEFNYIFYNYYKYTFNKYSVSNITVLLLEYSHLNFMVYRKRILTKNIFE